MEEVPSPKDLRGAGGVAHALAYVTGVAGIVAGAVVLRQGEVVLAVAVWVVTFAAGAMLMIAALLARAMSGLLVRLARIESDVSVLVADRGHAEPLEPPRNQPSAWG